MTEKKAPLDADAITGEMREGGTVAARIPRYECREEQLALTRLVVERFNDGGALAAEAGTGVGKSFAYLLPAIRFAEAADERVVVSTATINLQRRLFDEDIPFLARATGAPVKAALLKGRGNFLCLRRLRDEAGGAEPDGGALRAVAAWAGKTASGDRDDLPSAPDPALWARVSSDADACAGANCAFREECFFTASRREAEAARILVVNHHLLFADAAARMEGAGYGGTVVLPPYRRVVLDEAHRVPDAAISFFSARMEPASLDRRIRRLARRKGALHTGILARLRAGAPGGISVAAFEDDLRLSERAMDALAALDRAGLLLCGETQAFRLVPARDALIRERLVPPLENASSALSAFCAHAASLLAPAAGEDGGEEAEDGGERAALARELGASLRVLRAAARLCDDFRAYAGDPGRVFWIERGAGRRAGDDRALWQAAPLEAGPLLREALFKPCKTVVCLSATLAPGGDFGYWLGRCGLGGGGAKGGAEGAARPVCAVFPSPFPYEKNVLLGVSADAPDPAAGGGAYGRFVNDAVFRLCRASGGGALVLFTSYGSLAAAWDACAAPLERLGIPCLRQDGGDRARLLARFIEDEASVLFGTDSFWEGVDAPGETLRLVVVCRLPFAAPGEPVLEARLEAARDSGGDPFGEISLPEAVMKFRQGFGRLVRGSGDRGVVAVLDGRLVRKSYGRAFLYSLPPTRFFSGDLDALERKTSAFFDNPPGSCAGF